MQSKGEVAESLKIMISEMFGITTAKLRPDALLVEELDLDSIDMVDLLARLNTEFALELRPQDFEGCASLEQFQERLLSKATSK